MLKVALFGTSADPPTAGHQAIIRYLSENYDVVAVWAADNPFKSHQTQLQHRVAMLQLLIADIDSPKKNIGLEQQLSSWKTIETLEKAKEHWGEYTEFILVVGSDLLHQLPNWYHAKDLLQQVQLLIVPRPGYVIEEDALEKIKIIGGKIDFANLTGLNVSSTAYRQHGDTQALIPTVMDYIRKEHLYS